MVDDMVEDMVDDMVDDMADNKVDNMVDNMVDMVDDMVDDMGDDMVDVYFQPVSPARTVFYPPPFTCNKTWLECPNGNGGQGGRHDGRHNPNPIERNSSSSSVTFFTHLPSHATKHSLSARRA